MIVYKMDPTFTHILIHLLCNYHLKLAGYVSNQWNNRLYIILNCQ